MAEFPSFEPRGDYIDGGFVLPAQPSGEIALEDPSDSNAELGAFPFSLPAVDAAVAAARRAWPAWRDGPPEERAVLLRRFGEAIQAEGDALALLISREEGKPLWEARAEVAAMVAKVENTLGPGLERVREQRLELAPGQVGRWSARARGVLGVLGPFNFQGHLSHGHVVPALATGNTVVLKPSEHAPAVGQLYADLAARVGFPRGVFNLVQGDAASGSALATHADLDGILFTGSYDVGRRILEATLDQPWKLVALEMGGKNAVLVAADADLEAAARAIAFGLAVTTGQRCSATSRVIVESGVAHALVERLRRILSGLRIGLPLVDDVFMGPLISKASRTRHAQLIEQAAREGAELLVSGGPIEGPRPGHYVRPSLHRVQTLARDSRYQCEEHFVPDAFLFEVDSLEAGFEAVNASDYGLVASVFTRDRETWERARRELRIGLLNWNTSTVGASSKLPFGGRGRSGNDRPAGILSSEYCTAPLASLEFETPGEPARWPGFPEP